MVQTKLGQKRDKKIQQKVQKPAEIRDLARSGKKIQLETLSLFTWATKKKHSYTFHYTGWLIAILIMAYEIIPIYNWLVFHPLYQNPCDIPL